MSKGRRNHGHKELNQLQICRKENEKLKKEISSLRKQLARIDLDRYAHVKNIVEEHYANEKEEKSAQDLVKSLKDEWQCRECGEGHLEITLYTRRDGTFYHRACNVCTNRTKVQKYDPETVKGIMRKPKPTPEKKPF